MTERRAFYDGRAALRLRESERYYHQLLKRCYAFLVPPGQRVLEVGCGLGDLLAATNPARGVGVDFSPAVLALARKRHPQLKFAVADALEIPTEEKFDYLVLSDLVNDLPDVQALLTRLREVSHADTRLVVNFFNNLWRPMLAFAEKIGAKAPALPQNWLSSNDMKNLLHLA